MHSNRVVLLLMFVLEQPSVLTACPCIVSSLALKDNSSEVVQPFLMGCGTKEPKITQLCLAAIQRLMSHEVVSEVRNKRLICFYCKEIGLDVRHPFEVGAGREHYDDPVRASTTLHSVVPVSLTERVRDLL